MTSSGPQMLAVRHEAEKAAALFPAMLLEAERIAQSVSAGLHGRRRAGPGETFWQHRPYAFGDPVSTIDWRQSARASDRLYVRQNEWEAAAAAYLWRDPSHSLDYASAKDWPTKRRRADVLLTALTILLSQAGERIGLLGDARRPFQGRNAPERMLEALGAEKFDDAKGAPPLASTPAGARIVMASDFYTAPENVDRAVAALAGSGAKGVLLQICDPAEEEFPFEGRVEFRDLESADRLVFGETGSLAGAYKAKFAAHRDALETIAQKNGWSFLAHRTDKPPQTALLALFTALADMRIWQA
ncbi:DUF58 domain-containing protein [Hyphococcus luteus]|uniref:DUF58 domain-containing protein n=1 Tax=Hyphococcus luteus TaxID=2058213 RepID=A0A2S7K9Z7_9PROT|nr:DUF58 domain-containing protein [Marinicaulis flavus]PQA89322.1 DUF58 domain-containing protein [Marinicaulis flavus]